MEKLDIKTKEFIRKKASEVSGIEKISEISIIRYYEGKPLIGVVAVAKKGVVGPICADKAKQIQEKLCSTKKFYGALVTVAEDNVSECSPHKKKEM